MLNQFESITKEPSLFFSHCQGCQTSCCDGSRFIFAPLILEDFVDVYRYFPIFFAKLYDEWRILMLFSQEGACRYYTNGECSIYSHRPPSCRLYPLSPYFDEIFVDRGCGAVNTHQHGNVLVSGGSINPAFYHERLDNFPAKRQRTISYLAAIAPFLVPYTTFQGIMIYRYEGGDHDPYIRMHHASLEKFPLV